MFRLLTALAIFALFPVTGHSVQDQNKLVVALAANLTQSEDPSASPYGRQLRKGIDLALAQAQAKLKKAGLQIEIKEYDSKGSNLEVSKVAQQVLASDAVAVTGHLFSSEALIAGKIYGEKSPLLFVSPGATAERLQKIGSHIVSTVFNNVEQAKVLIQLALDKKLKKAAVISVKDCAYCSNLKQHFVFEAKQTQLKVFQPQEILSDDTDLKGKLSIKELREADVIFLPNYESVNARLIHYLSQRGVNPKYYLGGDGWGLNSEVFRKMVGDIKFKALTLSYWSQGMKSKSAINFSSKFQKTFNTLPTDSAVLAYDGMNRLIDIILKSERPITRESLLKAKAQVTESQGVLGQLNSRLDKIARPFVALEYDGLNVTKSQVRRNKL